ncbi:MAG: N-acetylmuramoyl-L-alanine amidase, partial [Proteobacteria bacterium]|nr:N-acetylmuramoyl-L-alanine amidase [Pseudomonadota bacterium]
IELEARTAFANKHRGDLFISIHANASLKKHVSGVETYFLNLTTDEDALTLAAKENQTSLKSISDLQTILNDLMVNSKIKESRDLAEVIQSSMVDVTGRSNHKMKDLGVKQAPFTVLIGAQMPSVLVETGFISNAKENKVLRNETYKKVIANGIYQGIKQYID